MRSLPCSPPLTPSRALCLSPGRRSVNWVLVRRFNGLIFELALNIANASAYQILSMLSQSPLHSVQLTTSPLNSTISLSPFKPLLDVDWNMRVFFLADHHITFVDHIYQTITISTPKTPNGLKPFGPTTPKQLHSSRTKSILLLA